MDNNNQNQTNPFGAYQYGDGGPNRPREISSDLWTPISTGVPMQGTRKLTDKNETPPPEKKAQSPKPKRPQAGAKHAAPKKNRKKARPAAPKKSAPRPQPGQAQTERPVVRPRPQTERKPGSADIRRRQREQRERENDERQSAKDREQFENERSAGRSSDELRRKKALKKRRKKRLRAVITVAAVMLIAGIVALIYCFAYGAPIAKITVSGKTDYSNEDIISACGVKIGDNMLRVRSRDVALALSGVMPYIESVKVQYKLPDTLVLKVTQTKEKYLIVGKNSYLCLNEEGKVLSLKKKKVKEGQYRLEGFEWQDAVIGTSYEPNEANKPRYETALSVVKQLESVGLTGVNAINLAALQSVVLCYEGRINIYVDLSENAEDLSQKLNLVMGILKNEVSPSAKGYIDARFEGRAFYSEGSMKIDG